MRGYAFFFGFFWYMHFLSSGLVNVVLELYHMVASYIYTPSPSVWHNRPVNLLLVIVCL